MRIRFFRPPFVAKLLYPEALFRIKTSEKKVFLTFDDGPDPSSTSPLLEILGANGVVATFFCSGRRAEKYPELINEIDNAGHRIGNHGYHHFDGWKTSCSDYIENIKKASQFTSSSLYRPPYGRMTIKQYRSIVSDYRIIMWDVLTYDFDIRFRNTYRPDFFRQLTRNGSIVCLHDNPNSFAIEFLGYYIPEMKEAGFSFGVIP